GRGPFVLHRLLHQHVSCPVPQGGRGTRDGHGAQVVASFVLNRASSGSGGARRTGSSDPGGTAGARPSAKGELMSMPISNAATGSGQGAPRPYVPAHPSIPIDSGVLTDRFAKFEAGARKIRWDDQGPVTIDWSTFDRSKLTLDNLLVVKLVTFVE